METSADIKRKVLVADDNKDVNNVIASVLGEDGYNVIQVFDGTDALEAFLRHRPDLVLLDYRMPGMDGIDVLREIRRSDANAPVVFMTGEGSENVAVSAMKAGADDYITKPINFPDLTPLVHKLIREHEILLENMVLRARGDAYKEYLVTLSETMGEALVTTDANGYIQYLNSMARKLWGREEDLMGQPVEKLFHASHEDVFQDIKDALSKGMNWFEDEYSFVKNDSSAFSGLLTASELKSEKYAGGIVIVVRDLTEIDEMRRQVINAEKLASLGMVVEGVAHEIRNSLTSLGGFSRRLEKTQDLDKIQRIYIEYIIEDVKRLEAMIKDIEEYVNYTKIHRPMFITTNIETIIDAALIKTFESGKFSGVSYEVNLPDELDTIDADFNYLVEAFCHLFINACEAMDGSGSLDINVSMNPSYMIVDVTDTGKGIPKEEIKEIFNPFYTSKVTGAGLGLSKVYMIIEEHGGFITVHSTEGKGTRMRVYLSRKRNAPAKMTA